MSIVISEAPPTAPDEAASTTAGTAAISLNTTSVTTSTSTADIPTLIPTPLSLAWTYGFTFPSTPSSSTPSLPTPATVHSLTTPSASAVLYSSSHLSIIHNLERDRQTVLEGHVHNISASAVTKDKAYIVTADDGAGAAAATGEDGAVGSGSVIIVWETRTGRAVRVIERHSGVSCIDLSDDGMFIAAVSNTSPQRLAIYEWNVLPTSPPSSPSRPAVTPATAEAELPTPHVHCVRFSSSSLQDLVLNSPSAVLFYSWTPAVSASLVLSVPSLGERRHSGTAAAGYTQSCFIPYSSRAITATSSGHIVVWDRSSSSSNGSGGGGSRTAVKTLKLLKCCIAVMAVVADRYVACGCSDGVVRFFDFQFRIAGWCDELKDGLGGITALSFDHLPVRPPAPVKLALTAPPGGAGGSEFSVPSFVVATGKGKVVAMQPAPASAAGLKDKAGSSGAVVVSAFDSAVTSVHCHPSLPLFASATAGATLSVWDLDDRRLIGSRTFVSSSAALSVVRFSPYGNLLAVGFSSGELRIVDTSAIASTTASASSFLADVALFRPSGGAVLHVTWSSCGSWLACADEQCNVSVYRWWHADDDVRKDKEWVYLGRYRSHYGAVVALLFAPAPASSAPPPPPLALPPLLPPSLVSLGADRTLHVYDLSSSSIRNGLRILSSHVVEEIALPVAMVRLSGRDLNGGATGGRRVVESDGSDVLVIANDEYKLKVWEVGPHGELTLRRTLLAPTFCGGITALSLLPPPLDPTAAPACARQLLFSSSTAGSVSSSYLGLLSLPLLGHPASAVAVLSHPAASSSCFSSTFDGSAVLSFAPDDTAVKVWRLHPAAAPRSALEDGEAEDEVWAELLEAERGDGDRRVVERVEELMMYCEVQREGEERRQRRTVSGTVGLDDIVPLCRALGCYVTEREGRDIRDECTYLQRLREAADDAQQQDGRVTQADFVRLYVNHRPLYGLAREQFQWALRTLKADGDDDDGQAEGGAEEVEVDRAELLRLLMSEGERMSAAELEHCLDALLEDGRTGEYEHVGVGKAEWSGVDEDGEVRRLLARLPARLTADTLASTLLGFHVQ